MSAGAACAPASEAMATSSSMAGGSSLACSSLDCPFVTSEMRPRSRAFARSRAALFRLVPHSFSVLPLVIGGGPHDMRSPRFSLACGAALAPGGRQFTLPFHEYAEARRIDAATAATIERGDGLRSPETRLRVSAIRSSYEAVGVASWRTGCARTILRHPPAHTTRVVDMRVDALITARSLAGRRTPVFF